MQFPEKFFALSLRKNVLISKSRNEVRIIFKRRDVSEPLVFMMAVKDLYDKLLEAHIQTGHEAKRMNIFSEKMSTSHFWRYHHVICPDR